MSSPTLWVRQRCWEQPALSGTDWPDVSGASCLHLSFSQLSGLWKTFANKHPSPKLTSWQRRGKKTWKESCRYESELTGGGEGRDQTRHAAFSKHRIFSLLSCKLLFLPTCLQNVAFFKVNRCLQKLLKCCRSSFGTWFHISSAIGNPEVYLNLRLKFRSLVRGRPFNGGRNTGVRLILSWEDSARYWRARVLWCLWLKGDYKKKQPSIYEAGDTP